MNYIEWCEFVLTTLGEESNKSPVVRNSGIDDDRFEKIIWGNKYDEVKIFMKSSGYTDVMDDTIIDLSRINLIDRSRSPFFKLTLNGQTAANNLFLLWEKICSMELSKVWEKTLKIVNKLSNKPEEYFATAQDVYLDEIHQELSAEYEQLTEEDVQDILWKLRGDGLIFCSLGDYIQDVRATYRGLVWEARRGFTIESKFIDELVKEWETTNVDFKREISLDTKKQKAEFVKDVLGLANTKSSGRRYLIIGFDDKTQNYHASPEVRVTQERMERILSDLTDPVVNIRYEIIDYRLGKAGKLEVIRESVKLPYRAAKDVLIDEKGRKGLEKDKVYVRHGSQTEAPTDMELQDLEKEGQRARDE